jgi:hypothetical protein
MRLMFFVDVPKGARCLRLISAAAGRLDETDAPFDPWTIIAI